VSGQEFAVKPFVLVVSCSVVFSSLLSFSNPSSAVELHHIDVHRGTDGLKPAPLDIVNSGSGRLSCTAELAHWYSKDLGTIAPAAETRIPLWFDPASGSFFLLNEGEDNMPVEALWCGIDGKAYATRKTFRLDRDTAQARRIECAGRNGKLTCG
jgi:hypothetical protein